jgi:hypothetical protein
VEPFFLRCETCHARLRVRDERFLGQVQACPKCGSMVHILAPPADVAPASEAVATNAATASVGASLLAVWRDHSRWWITGAAATSAVGALAIVLALRGTDRDVAALSPTQPVVAEKVAAPIQVVKQESPPAFKEEPNQQTVQTKLPTPTPTPPVEQVATAVVPADAAPPVVPPPPSDVVPAASHEKPRTLTLEPVKSEPSATTVTVEAVPNYPPANELDTSVVAAKPQAARPPTRVTNVADQLAVPIEAIDLPAMPIGEFVNLVSGMAAVPIQLDAKVLGEAGLSSRSTVIVHGENTTLGQLLARVLGERQLQCVEQDGALVVVPAKR